MKRIPRLHVITDETVQTRFAHGDLARLALAGGADCVQFREKRPWSTSALVGFDTVLLNTAVARADDPVRMAAAFAKAVAAGRLAFEAGAMAISETAHASTPVVGTPFRQSENG